MRGSGTPDVQRDGFVCGERSQSASGFSLCVMKSYWYFKKCLEAAWDEGGLSLHCGGRGLHYLCL